MPAVPALSARWHRRRGHFLYVFAAFAFHTNGIAPLPTGAAPRAASSSPSPRHTTAHEPRRAAVDFLGSHEVCKRSAFVVARMSRGMNDVDFDPPEHAHSRATVVVGAPVGIAH